MDEVFTARALSSDASFIINLTNWTVFVKYDINTSVDIDQYSDSSETYGTKAKEIIYNAYLNWLADKAIEELLTDTI